MTRGSKKSQGKSRQNNNHSHSKIRLQDRSNNLSNLQHKPLTSNSISLTSFLSFSITWIPTTPNWLHSSWSWSQASSWTSNPSPRSSVKLTSHLSSHYFPSSTINLAFTFQFSLFPKALMISVNFIKVFAEIMKTNQNNLKNCWLSKPGSQWNRTANSTLSVKTNFSESLRNTQTKQQNRWLNSWNTIMKTLFLFQKSN